MKNSMILTIGLIASAIVDGVHASDKVDGAASAADSMIVIRDARTGQLRAPTATEAAALRATKAKRLSAAVGAAAAPTAVRTFEAGGAHSARLPEALASYSVVRRAADGSVDETCVQGRDAARAALHEAPAAEPANKKDNTK